MFESGGFEPVSFIDDEQFAFLAVLGFRRERAGSTWPCWWSMAQEMCWQARGRPCRSCLMVAATVVKKAVLLCWTASGTGGSTAAAGKVGAIVPGLSRRRSGGRRASCRSLGSVAEADVAVGADCVCELFEPAVLPRGHERWLRCAWGGASLNSPAELRRNRRPSSPGSKRTEMGRLLSGSVVGIGSQSVPAVALRGRGRSPLLAQLRAGWRVSSGIGAGVSGELARSCCFRARRLLVPRRSDR